LPPPRQRSQEGSTKGRTGGGGQTQALSRHPVGFAAQTPSLPPVPLHPVTDRPHLNRAEGVETRIAASHRTDVPRPPQDLGVVTAPATKPEGCTRPEQNAGSERRRYLKNPREPYGKERHGAGSCTETEAGAEHGCKGELEPVVRVTEKPPSTFEPGEPPDAILECRTESRNRAAGPTARRLPPPRTGGSPRSSDHLSFPFRCQRRFLGISVNGFGLPNPPGWRTVCVPQQTV
jgi:hypothetical protein